MKDGRRFGGPPKPYQPPAIPAGKVNLTDSCCVIDLPLVLIIKSIA
jgi:hypothetical protein